MKPTNRHPGPTPAFTLIELLVVIAIIALLVSILLPTLSRAKKLAAAAACLSNLRNSGMGLRMYCSDETAGKWVGYATWYDLTGYWSYPSALLSGNYVGDIEAMRCAGHRRYPTGCSSDEEYEKDMSVAFGLRGGPGSNHPKPERYRPFEASCSPDEYPMLADTVQWVYDSQASLRPPGSSRTPTSPTCDTTSGRACRSPTVTPPTGRWRRSWNSARSHTTSTSADRCSRRTSWTSTAPSTTDPGPHGRAGDHVTGNSGR